jgi:hypothetical protein
MTPHVHISALDGAIVMCYVILGITSLHLIARRKPESAWAQALLDVIA